MTMKTLRFRTTENQIADIKKVASVYHMSVGKAMREALNEYVDRMKQKPFYRLTADIEEADPEESAEILAMIENMTDDDWETASVKHITVEV